MLTAHRTSGEKTQAHDRYLKGSVYCGECGSRLILTNAKSRRGVIYPHFICSSRHSESTSCERKAINVPDLEAAVEDYYRSIQIAPHVATALRELIIAEFDRLHATSAATNDKPTRANAMGCWPRGGSCSKPTTPE